MDLNNAWVIITGASRGIGYNIAEEFAKRKTNIILIARSMDALKKICEQVENLGGKAHAISFDLENISQIENLVEEINKLAPHIDVLVNNAGLEKYCFFSKCSNEDIMSILSVNLIAPMELTRLLLPDMLTRKKGHIINIGSIGGNIGEIYNSLYVTSKGGMELWTDVLRQELHKTGIKVSMINPGGVTDSGMIYNIGLNYPAIMGFCKVQDVAEEVVKCTSKYKSRVFVNSMPVKPLIIVNSIFPRLIDAFLRWIGLPKVNREKIDRRLEKEMGR